MIVELCQCLTCSPSKAVEPVDMMIGTKVKPDAAAVQAVVKHVFTCQQKLHAGYIAVYAESVHPVMSMLDMLTFSRLFSQ